MRIQLDVSKDNAQQIKVLMGRADFHTHSELFNNAVTLVEWAVRQVEGGCVIAAVDADNDQMRELSMPFLKHVSDSRPTRTQPAQPPKGRETKEDVVHKPKARGAGSN